MLIGDPVWWPGGEVRSSRIVHVVENSIYHQLPSYVLDFFARLTGQPPMYVYQCALAWIIFDILLKWIIFFSMQKIQDKLSKAASCLEYFATQEWKFRDDNVRRLCSYMSPADQLKFDFDVKNIDWDSYLQSYILGIRRFIFKENPNSLPKARSQLNRYVSLNRLIFSHLVIWNSTRTITFSDCTGYIVWRNLC